MIIEPEPWMGTTTYPIFRVSTVMVHMHTVMHTVTLALRHLVALRMASTQEKKAPVTRGYVGSKLYYLKEKEKHSLLSIIGCEGAWDLRPPSRGGSH